MLLLCILPLDVLYDESVVTFQTYLSNSSVSTLFILITFSLPHLTTFIRKSRLEIRQTAFSRLSRRYDMK